MALVKRPVVKWEPKLWKTSDFLNEPLKGGKWLIPKLVPAESIGWISGLPKQGFKTWLAWQLAGMITGRTAYVSEKGGEWRRPPLGGKVLVFEDEGSHLASKERVNKVALGLGARWDVTKFWLPLPEGMDADDPDRPYDWRTKVNQSDPIGKGIDDNLIISHGDSVKLDIPERRDRVLELCKEHKPVLVIFDPWTYALSGDENEKKDVAVGVDAVKAIRKLGIAVLALVHLKKDSGDSDDIDKDMRGHTILRDTYDVHLGCRRPKDRDIITLTARMRDGKRQKYEMFWRIPDEGTMGPVKLDLVNVSDKPKNGEKEAVPPSHYIDRLLGKGIVRGYKYSPSRFYEIWRCNPGRGAEIVGLLAGLGLAAIDGDKILIPALTEVEKS
jgi:hypothetical protein